MMGKFSRNVRIFGVLLIMMAWWGCSSDSPTAPTASTGNTQSLAAVKNLTLDSVHQTVDYELPGRYIVQLVASKSPAKEMANTLANRHGFAVGQVYQSAVKGFVAEMTVDEAATLAADPEVMTVEHDKIMTVFGQTLPTGVDRLDVERNPYAGFDGGSSPVDVDIAIVDTGIDANHPDLNVVGGVRFIGGVQDPDFMDGFGHGTHVAGIAAALNNDLGVVGVAPGARLWGVKVLDDNGSGNLSDIIAGLDWVAAHSDVIEVLNMSLGGFGWSDAYRSAVAGCVNQGVVVVVAAGNMHLDIFGFDHNIGNWDDTVPAAFPEAMTISALADNDGLPGGLGAATSAGADDTFASFSNYATGAVPNNPVTSTGAGIDLMLPGVDILSTIPGGGYAPLSGTSMASPHGAGLVALYIAEHGRATDASGVYAIRQALIDQGAAQTSSWGLAAASDPDGHLDPVGMAAPQVDFADIGFVSFEAPEVITQGETIRTRIRLSNRGTLAVTTPVTVRMFESTTGRELIVPRTATNGIPVGTTILGTPHFPTNASVAPGLYTLVVEHDFVDGITFNNSMSVQVEIVPPVSGLVVSNP